MKVLNRVWLKREKSLDHLNNYHDHTHVNINAYDHILLIRKNYKEVFYAI